MTKGEVAARAADVIEQRGHCKGSLEGPHGEVCLNGAMAVALWGNASGGPSDDLEGAMWLDLAMTIHLRLGNASPVYNHKWNDASHRTAGDVIALLREIAADEHAVVEAKAHEHELTS